MSGTSLDDPSHYDLCPHCKHYRAERDMWRKQYEYVLVNINKIVAASIQPRTIIMKGAQDVAAEQST